MFLLPSAESLQCVFLCDSLLQVMELQSLKSYHNKAVPSAALLFVYVDRAHSLPVRNPFKSQFFASVTFRDYKLLTSCYVHVSLCVSLRKVERSPRPALSLSAVTQLTKPRYETERKDTKSLAVSFYL